MCYLQFAYLYHQNNNSHLRKNIFIIISLLIIILLIGTCVFDSKKEEVPLEKKLISLKSSEYFNDSCIVILNKNWQSGLLDSVLYRINNQTPVFYSDADKLVFISENNDTVSYNRSQINTPNPLLIFTPENGPILTNAIRFQRVYNFYFPILSDTIDNQNPTISFTHHEDTVIVIKYRDRDKLKPLESVSINFLDLKKTIQAIPPRPKQELEDRSLYYPLLNGNRYLNIRFDNDFWDYTDYYYSNGAAIGYSHSIFAFSPISRILVSNRTNGLDYYGLQAVQHLYTGFKPKIDSIVQGDRPWSAYSTIGQFLTSYDLQNKIKHYSEFNIGLIGPESGGGFIQNLVHTILPNNSPPQGWDNQIANDIIIDYQYEIRKMLYERNKMESYIKTGAQAGTLRDNLSWGFGFRYGKFIPFYKDVSIYRKKRLPISSSHKLRFNIVIEVETQLIGYDATLQGGVFNKSSVYVIPSSQINRFVMEGIGGFEISYGPYELQFLQFWKSKEFKTGKDHKYVSVRLNFAF